MKTHTKSLKIAVVGLGYVGLPNLINYCSKGHFVTGYDIDKNKLAALRKGHSYIEDVSNETLALYKELMHITDDSNSLVEQDFIIIDVPTPITQNNEPDLRYVQCAVDTVLAKVRKGQTIILESTVAPTTSERLLVLPLQEMGFTIGEDIFVAYSPERVDPGNKQYTNHDIARVVGGHTEACLQKAVALIGDLSYPVSSMRVAELSKLYENTFRFVNISLANEIAKVTQAMGISFNEVMEAASSKPFGFMPFHPSIGIGGHCIPIDPYYLTDYAKTLDIGTPLIEAAANVNDSMLDGFLLKVMEHLNSSGLPFIKSSIAVIGASYKPNVADMRMAVSNSLVDKLNHYGSTVDVFDDLAVDTAVGSLGSYVKKLEYDLLPNYDLIIINTQHECVNYEAIHTLSNNVIYANDFGVSNEK